MVFSIEKPLFIDIEAHIKLTIFKKLILKILIKVLYL